MSWLCGVGFGSGSQLQMAAWAQGCLTKRKLKSMGASGAKFREVIQSVSLSLSLSLSLSGRSYKAEFASYSDRQLPKPVIKNRHMRKAACRRVPRCRFPGKGLRTSDAGAPSNRSRKPRLFQTLGHFLHQDLCKCLNIDFHSPNSPNILRT